MKDKKPTLKYYLLETKTGKKLKGIYYTQADVLIAKKALNKNGIKCRAYTNEGYWVV
jgi:hypothetical protein